MKVKPSSIAIALGIGVAAYLIWRNIKKTPKESDDSNFINATGSAYAQTRVPKKSMGLRQLFDYAGPKKGICPPQCE